MRKPVTKARKVMFVRAKKRRARLASAFVAINARSAAVFKRLAE